MFCSQEVGGTLIGKDRLMVIAETEYVEWYEIQIHSFHVFDAVPGIIMSSPPLSSLH
jgi:hypothetical protein